MAKKADGATVSYHAVGSDGVDYSSKYEDGNPTVPPMKLKDASEYGGLNTGSARMTVSKKPSDYGTGKSYSGDALQDNTSSNDAGYVTVTKKKPKYNPFTNK